MTPEDLERKTPIAIQVMWFPAFEALLHADPETALREANRSLERLRSLEGGSVENSPMAALYLTLGKIGRAREWSEESTEPGARRQVYLAAIAYVEEDHKAMKEHLEQALQARESLRRMRGHLLAAWAREPNTRPQVENFLSGNGPDRLGPTFKLLLAPVGLLSEWELNRGTDPGRPDLPEQRRRTRRESIKKRRDILRGMLTVSQDNSIEELKILGDALSSISSSEYGSAATYFMGSEILAEAWRKQGDAINAAEVLRTALEKEAFLPLDQSVLTGPLWLKLRAQLSKLYREMGRYEDAREIEEELRRRLALADPGHPILRQLDRTQDLALREPTDN